MRTRFQMQDEQYSFPYHHLVDISEARLHRHLRWGLERFGIVKTVRDLVPSHAHSIAEVGCGDGAVLREVGRANPGAQLTGFDITETGIALARALVPGVTFHCADFAHAPSSYDVVLCVETLEHIPDKDVRNFVDAMKGKIRPGGCLIISVPSDVRLVQAKHFRHYSRHLLLEHLGASAERAEVYEVHAVNSASSLLSYLLANKLWVLNHGGLRRQVFDLYDRRYRVARAGEGAHLVVKVAF